MKIEQFYKAIDDKDIDKWIPQPKGFYDKIFNEIINSEGKVFEIDIDQVKSIRPRASINSIISAFYSWKKKKAAKQLLDTRNFNVKIVKRDERIAIVKIPTTGLGKC